MQVDFRRRGERGGEVGLLAVLQRLHRVVQHVRIELEADLVDLARLLVAEHFAGAADLEVVHRKIEAGAQFLHLLDRFQPALRLLGQRLRIVDQQVRIGLVMRAADAAAQLVELREAELVRAVHDDRVRARHVDAGLDDGRAQQHVRALRDEVAHHPFELAFVHLAVRDHDAGFRYERLEHRLAVLDRLDLVVQEVHLAAALQFAQHRLADHAFFLAAHEGLDREPLLRRGCNDREIAQPFERHPERARDRRGGERQHVDFRTQRLQRFLLAHAETVFLVDDHEAEALELHVRRQQLVRADHDVDAAFVDLRDRRVDFLRGLEARQLDDPHRPVGEAVGEGLRVLLGEQRGRRQQRDLLAAQHRDERGAQRDLGLAEADVAAHEAVHRLAARHVADHGRDGGRLVGRFLEAEAFRELHVVARIERERVAFAGRAARVQVQQLGGRIADLLCGLALRALPLAGAERVQRRAVGIGAAVARDHVQLRDRHVELAVARVFEMQEFRLAFAEIHRHEAHVAADAVLRVDDRVAHLQLRQVAHHRVDVARLFLPAAARAAAERAVQFGLGDDRVAFARHREAVRERRDAECEACVALEPAGEVVVRCGAQMVFGEQLEDRLAAAGRFDGQQHALARRFDERAQRGERIVGMAIDREFGQARCPAAGRLRREHDARERLRECEEILVGQEQALRFEDRPLAIVREERMALLRIGREAADRRFEIAGEHEVRILRQVVEQRGGFVEEQRQVVLDAGRRHAVADVLVDRRAARVAFEGFAPAAAEGRARGFVERELAAGQKTHVAHRVEAALRVRVERADRVDLVVEQVDPVRQRRAHRVQVDQRSAHAVFAGPHDLAYVLVAGQRELRLQLRLVEPLALRECERVRGHERRRRHPVQRGGRGYEQDVAAALAEVVQRRETFGHEVLVRRERVVRQRFPVRQQAHARVG